MSKPLPVMILMVLLTLLWANLTIAAPDALMARSSGDAYWLVRIDSTTSGDLTSIRERINSVTGQWSEIARLRTRVIDAAPKGNQLAVLLANGEWKLLHGSAGSSADGRALPSPYRAIALAGDGNALLAIAVSSVAASSQPATAPSTTPSTTPSTPPSPPVIFRWDGTDWKWLAGLPTAADPTTASLVSVQGKVHLAYRRGEVIAVDQLVESRWQQLAEMPAAAKFKLLANSPRVLIAGASEKGDWSVSGVPSTQPIRTFESKPLGQVVMVGPTLRLVYAADDDKIEQVGFDDFGTGSSYPPAVIAQVGAPANTMQGWVQIIGLVLLTITMLFTFRQRPTGPNDVVNTEVLRLAPLMRRLAAGVIDAVPVLLAIGYGGRQLQAMPPSIDAAQASLVPFMIGLTIYLLHVTISELIWARTLGKFLFGLRVTMYDGTRPPKERLLLRNVMRLVDLLYIPLVLVAVTPMRQRFGDFAARTIVVMDPAEIEAEEKQS